MQYYIILLFLFCILILLIIFFLKNNNNTIHYYNDIIYIQKFSTILVDCKNAKDFKSFALITTKDVENYLNYLSCKCKGIGYWGGFCLEKDRKNVGGNEVHDEKLANTLGNLFINKRVADFGAGLGWYCPIISKYSKVCDEYDGSANIEDITHGRIKYFNLAEPLKMECNYDYIISIEVAEHIPKEYEDIYINNLIKCSKEGIVITWAKIGQAGHFHVNNRAREDVIKLFAKKGLEYDNKKTEDISNGTEFEYLKNNILFFKH